jgi:hypothetical protein
MIDLKFDRAFKLKTAACSIIIALPLALLSLPAHAQSAPITAASLIPQSGCGLNLTGKLEAKGLNEEKQLADRQELIGSVGFSTNFTRCPSPLKLLEMQLRLEEMRLNAEIIKACLEKNTPADCKTLQKP